MYKSQEFVQNSLGLSFDVLSLTDFTQWATCNVGCETGALNWLHISLATLMSPAAGGAPSSVVKSVVPPVQWSSSLENNYYSWPWVNCEQKYRTTMAVSPTKRNGTTQNGGTLRQRFTRKSEIDQITCVFLCKSKDMFKAYQTRHNISSCNSHITWRRTAIYIGAATGKISLDRTTSDGYVSSHEGEKWWNMRLYSSQILSH